MINLSASAMSTRNAAAPGEKDPMFQPGQKTLTGPLIGSRGWWQEVVGLSKEPPSSGQTTRKAKKANRRPQLNQDQPPDLSHIPGIRVELVARVRREIAAGTYDTPEKWELALERLEEHLTQ